MNKLSSKFSISLLTFLLIFSLGFANTTGASSKIESINNGENLRFTTEVSNPLKVQPMATEDSYFFEGTFENVIYTQESVTVDSNFWFYVDLYSTTDDGYVTVTVQRKGWLGYNDVKSYFFPPNYDNSGGSDRTYLSDLESGEYRLKIERSISEYTTVDGGMGGY